MKVIIEAIKIRFYFAILIIPLGVLLNFLAILVFIRRKLNKNSIFGFLNTWLCGFNLIDLLNEFIFSILSYNEIDPITYSSFTCRFLYGLIKYVNHLPSVHMIIMAFYLYITICHPTKKDFFGKHKFTIIIANLTLITIIDCIFIVYDRQMTEMESINSSNISYSIFECKTKQSLDFFIDWLDLSIRAFIPFCLILFLNILSIKKFSQNKMLKKSKSHTNKKVNFTNAIFLTNFMFLIIYLPWSIFFIIYHLNHSFQIAKNVSDSKSFEIGFVIFQSIAYLNNMDSFLINYSFNSIFREELLTLFHLNLNRIINYDSSKTNK